MIIESLELKDYRNYESLNIKLSSGVNIFYGDNAQGKTNILESIYLATTSKSHRGSKDKDILEMIFKMSFRDVFGFQKNYRIYFSNLKILITSLTDYYYFITFLDKDEEKVKNLVKKSKLFLR